MMDIYEYCQQAEETDGLNVAEMIRKHFPYMDIGKAELFPDYPLQPYRQLDPKATHDDIFLMRVKPWLIGTVKLIAPNVPNIPLTVHLQTSPYSGAA